MFLLFETKFIKYPSKYIHFTRLRLKLYGHGFMGRRHRTMGNSGDTLLGPWTLGLVRLHLLHYLRVVSSNPNVRQRTNGSMSVLDRTGKQNLDLLNIHDVGARQ